VQIYIDNTNVITLYRLKSAVDNLYIADADVSVTIVNKDGTAVAAPDGTWPLAMQETGESPSKGDYQAVLSDEIEFIPNTTYVAVVEVDAGPDRIGHWEVPFVARTRK
jgi:hypothetical protein